jgi:uncharacterized MAPEG superfamily protein
MRDRTPGENLVTTDLWMLVATGLLSLAIPFVYAIGRFQAPGGVQWSFLNRDDSLDTAPWVSRAYRAHLNLIENIGPFAILVIAAHLSGQHNEITARGSAIFFVSRVAHVLFYTAGIPYLRTVSWFSGWVGGMMILTQLIG